MHGVLRTYTDGFVATIFCFFFLFGFFLGVHGIGWGTCLHAKAKNDVDGMVATPEIDVIDNKW